MSAEDGWIRNILRNSGESTGQTAPVSGKRGGGSAQSRGVPVRWRAADSCTGDVLPILMAGHDHYINALRHAVEEICNEPVGRIADYSMSDLGLWSCLGINSEVLTVSRDCALAPSRRRFALAWKHGG